MTKETENLPSISKQTLNRMPAYLLYLQSLDQNDSQSVSATNIANELSLNEVQVRKDLAAVSRSGGRPRTGFVIKDLIEDIKSFLGYDDINNAVIVGAGKLGQALLSYQGFAEYGLNIIAAFDVNQSLIGQKFDQISIFPVEKMPEICRLLKIQIGIITVPAVHAQDACDRLIESGIHAIWNFAPILLSVPQDILVQNENMAISLAILSKHLSEKLKNNL